MNGLTLFLFIVSNWKIVQYATGITKTLPQIPDITVYEKKTPRMSFEVGYIIVGKFQKAKLK